MLATWRPEYKIYSVETGVRWRKPGCPHAQAGEGTRLPYTQKGVGVNIHQWIPPN